MTLLILRLIMAAFAMVYAMRIGVPRPSPVEAAALLLLYAIYLAIEDLGRKRA